MRGKTIADGFANKRKRLQPMRERGLGALAFTSSPGRHASSNGPNSGVDHHSLGFLPSWARRSQGGWLAKFLEWIGWYDESEIVATEVDQVELIALLCQRIEAVKRQALMEFEFESRIRELPISWERATVLLTILQDLIDFSVQETDASRLVLSVKKKDPFISLEFSDDGKGFDAASILTNPPGKLVRFKALMAQLNGRIEVRSIKHAGTQFTLHFQQDKLLSQSD